MNYVLNPQPGEVYGFSDKGRQWVPRIFDRINPDGGFDCYAYIDSFDPDKMTEAFTVNYNCIRPATPIETIRRNSLTVEYHENRGNRHLFEQWMDLCPEFDTDKYEYEFKVKTKIEGHDYSDWEWWNDTEWVPVMDRLLYSTVIRRPKQPTFKPGDRFMWKGDECMYVFDKQESKYKHGLLNLSTGVVENKWATYDGFLGIHGKAMKKGVN